MEPNDSETGLGPSLHTLPMMLLRAVLSALPRLLVISLVLTSAYSGRALVLA